jgi:superoxide dismutase, Fe-Mn family
MNYNKLFIIGFALTIVVSCKKNTLVEVVDVPANPIQVTKVKGGSGSPSEVKANDGNFKIMTLPYEYKALEPHFDATTMEIHYSKHHLGYVNNLNKGIIGKKYEFMKLNDIFKSLNLSDASVRNDAGGVYNHDLFWEILGANKGGEPKGELMEAIVRDFGSFDEFRNTFVGKSAQYFGSGWIWLVSDKVGKLKIITTANNDNPLMKGLGNSGIPLLTLDLWEHAYYLKFQNRKREYANTFFSVVNWEVVLKKYESIPNKKAKEDTTAQQEEPIKMQDTIAN